MKKIFILAAAALALAACDKNEDNPVPSTVAAQITATIGESSLTRAADTSWGVGDRIGITATVGGFAKQSNVLYATDKGDGAFEGQAVYIYNPMSLTAYYPFSGNAGTARGTIEAVTDAGDQTKEKQSEFDFLYASKEGVTTDNPNVNLAFSHRMSKLTLIFKNGTGMDVSKITAYKIEGLVLEGTFNTATGGCAAKSDAQARPLSIALTAGTVKSGEALASLILFPQAAETLALTITDSDGQYYACTLDVKDKGLRSGDSYEWTITVNKTGLVVDKSEIADWNKTTLASSAGSVLS